MPIGVDPDDLAVFFDPDGFGEAIELDGVGGLVAIWEHSTGELPIGGDRSVVVDLELFRLPAAQVPAPVTGMTLVVVRTGQGFRLIGEPRLAQHAIEWLCEGELI